MSEPGKALRAARLAAGISLSRMADLTHYSKAAIGHLETGRRAVSPAHVATFEAALGTRIDVSGRTASAADVDILRRAADLVTAVGLRHGGVQAAALATAQWDWAKGVLGMWMTDDVRVSLSDQAARVADRLAWSLADAGRVNRTRDVYQEARSLAQSRDVSAMVRINMASFVTERGDPHGALGLLAGLKEPVPVHEFTANGATALAYAMLADNERCVRYVGKADDAWAGVLLNELPECSGPYVSGHAAHAHCDAGKALYELARAGHSRVVPLAVERLELAVSQFGPDRAQAVARCHERLTELAG